MSDSADEELMEALGFSTEDFRHGLDVGKSFGWYEAYASAQKFFDRGEIELWLEWQRPKTMEEWVAFEEKYPDIRNR